MTGTIIKVNGDRIPVDCTEEEIVDVIQKAVGGYFELVHTHEGQDMWINEDGIHLKLPYNPTATLLWKNNLQGVIRGDVFVSDCICGKE